MKKSISRIKEAVESVGIDLGDVWSDWLCLDSAGRVIDRGRVKTTAVGFQKQFGTMPPCRVAIEVGAHSGWVSRQLKSLGHEVIVANARKVALIHQNRRKNNRIDAELLARLARVDPALLFPVQHRTEDSQKDLALLRSRDVLVRTRSSMINHVRGTCKTAGVRLPKCSAEVFSRRVRTAVPAMLGSALFPLVESIQKLTEQIRDYDRQIATMVGRYPAAQRLKKIGGVGPLTALAFVLTIEDPQRISRSRSAGAFFGLVPGSSDSGETHEPKRITKEGDRYCRRLLVSAAQYILGPFGTDCDLRRHGMAIGARGGKNAKKRAVVAVARKLAVLMHRLWVTEAEYIPLYNARNQAAA